jgi:hypothetical protein
MAGLSKRLKLLGKSLLAAGSHDFCPGLNRYVYWLKQPIGWFVLAALASLLVAVVLGPQGWVLFAGIVAVTLLGVLWPALAMRGLSAELTFDRRRATEQQPVRVKLTVSNRWPLPIWGLALDRGFAASSDRTGRPVIALGCVRPWSTAEFEWEHVPEARGILPIARPILSNGFPFGLWQSEREVSVPVKLLVWPRTFTLDGIPEVSGNRFAVTGMLQQKAGHDGEFIGTRPYRQGDSLRFIHWAQTARQNELIVCERQTHCRRNVRIELDPALPGGQSEVTWEEQREWLFRVAASLCRAFHAHRFQIECRLGEELVQLPENALDIKPILDRMACWTRNGQTAAPSTPDEIGSTKTAPVTGGSKSASGTLQLLVTTPEQLLERVACSEQHLVLVQSGTNRVGNTWSPGVGRERVLLRVGVDQLAQHVSPQWLPLGESCHAA